MNIKEHLKAALEECTDCQQAHAGGGSMAGGGVVNTIKPTLVITGRASERSGGDNHFTYNDGEKDKKQLVQLTGPLGQAYVDALNIVFTKKPVLNNEDVPEDLDEHDMQNILTSARIAQDEQQAAQESYLTNGDRVADAIAEIVNAPAAKIIDEKANVRIVDEASLAAHAQNAADTTPNIIGYVTTTADVVKPQTLSYLERVAELRETRVVAVITDSARFVERGAGVKSRFVDLSNVKDYNPVVDKPDHDISIESLTELVPGVTFVNSFEAFMAITLESVQAAQPQRNTNTSTENHDESTLGLGATPSATDALAGDGASDAGDSESALVTQEPADLVSSSDTGFGVDPQPDAPDGGIEPAPESLPLSTECFDAIAAAHQARSQS